MTFSSALRSLSEGYDRGRLSGNALPQRALGGAAFAFVSLTCAWILWHNFAGVADEQATGEPVLSRTARISAKPPNLANAYARLAAAMHGYAQRLPAADSYAALFDPRYLRGLAPATFSASAAVEAGGGRLVVGVGRFTTKVAQDITSSLKTVDRVVENAASAALQPHLPRTRVASLGDSSGAAHTTVNKPTIFERLFGKPAPTPTLAYAAAEDGGLGEVQGVGAGRYDRFTAVYDISAHTVYMPDGTALEAHSGRGDRIDDPRYVDEKMRGATPPDVYDLVLREELFHGVQAIRLIPVDERKVLGRSGLLAHTYMLGPNGDSFGCVSFKDYNAFLQAYLNHRIKRLVVVAGPV